MASTAALSSPTRDTFVLTIGAHGVDQFVDLVEDFDLATRSACRVLVLDLSAVDRIDSDLLGLLLWAHRRLAERGASLVVARPTPATRSLLSRSGLDYVLTVSDDVPSDA